MREVLRVRREFEELDVSGDGELSSQELEQLVRRTCQIPDEEDVPGHLLNRHWDVMELDGNGSVDFEEFLIWRMNIAFTEEMLVPDPAARHLRHLARRFRVPLPQMERIKSGFDSFDTDGCGELDEDDFKKVLVALTKAESERDIPPRILKQYWQEVRSDPHGVRFEEFLPWYVEKFENCGTAAERRQSDHV